MAAVLTVTAIIQAVGTNSQNRAERTKRGTVAELQYIVIRDGQSLLFLQIAAHWW